MLSSLSRLFGPAQPRVWLVQDDSGCWHKVVCYGRPNVKFAERLLGPFRSEVDAEETADRLNTVRTQQKVCLYRAQAPPQGGDGRAET